MRQEKGGDLYTIILSTGLLLQSQTMSTECETHTQWRNPLSFGIRGIQELSAGEP